MATSNSWDFSLTAGNIIQVSYEDLGVISPGATVPSGHSTLALRRLNMIAKQYQGTADGSGLKIHTRQRITLALAKGQQSYLIGAASTDARASTAFGRTTISADEAAAQTVLSITSNTDTTSYPGTTLTMTAGDIIGIELNDGTIQWTTISGTPAATATVSNALTGAASAGNYVYWFTSRAQRFPILESAVLRNADGTTSPLGVYTEAKQYDLGVSDKNADGTPTTLLFEPLRTQSRITFDAQPNDVTRQVVLTVLYPSEDYDATTDDIAYPQEALRFLSLELAFALAPWVGRWTPELEKARNETRQMWFNLNPENSVLYFQPNA